MAVRLQTLSYDGAGVRCDAVLAIPDGEGPFPAVMVAHAWMGRSDEDVERAKWLAEQGYFGFAIDMYGEGRLAESAGEAAALMGALDADRALLQRRVLAALAALQAQPSVDGSRIAAMGFCFGGKCVLDLARSGVNVSAVISLHGVYDPPSELSSRPIHAKVLVLHGWDDPLAPPSALYALSKELAACGADWQFHAYGGTGHAFTHVKAKDHEAGMFYQESSARRAFAATQYLLAEVFEHAPSA